MWRDRGDGAQEAAAEDCPRGAHAGVGEVADVGEDWALVPECVEGGPLLAGELVGLHLFDAGLVDDGGWDDARRLSAGSDP